MNRQEKSAVIDSIKNGLQQSQASFLVEYKGLDVATIKSLRQQLRKQGGAFKVAKVTLMRRALEQVPELKGLEDYLHDQVALVFSAGEVPAVAKILHEFSKNHAALHIRAGCLEAKVLNKDAVSALATLPSREVLLAQVCGSIKTPAMQVVQTMQGVMMQLVWVLGQIQEKKSAASSQ